MAKLSPEREAELEHWRDFERNQWRIAEECGLPTSEADKVRRMVQLEMQFHCSDFKKAISVAHHAASWIENGNPHHIDAAQVLCNEAGISPPPALAELAADVALKRLRGEIRAGTGGKILRQAAKDHTLTLMACLCAAGLTIREASRKAAMNHRLKFQKTYLASTLETHYSKRYRDHSRALAEYWATEAGAPVLAEWQAAIPKMPDAPPELWGEPD